MKDTLRYSITLMIVGFISALSLSLVNGITQSDILSQEEKEFNDALMVLLPGLEEQNIQPYQEEDQILYYKGYTDQKKTKILGYAFLVESQGYSSTIRTLVGMDTSGTILNIKILSQQETPGLGSRCEEVRNGETIPWWQAQFQNVNIDQLAIDKDGGQIESITGATITSKAITDSIANRAKKLHEIIHQANMNKD